MQGVQGYSQRIHIVAGEEVEAMEVRELLHPEADWSTSMTIDTLSLL